MTKNLRLWAVNALACVSAVALNSCTYDPNYTSVGSSYSTGYGDGYGYGGSRFSSSVFVGTGDPRWGYDPYCHSYFDHRRRAYYDPYLNGYYPVGYRPQVVYGVAHPHGWHPGRGYCRPPSRVTNVTIRDYRNRESAYRNSGYISSGRTYGHSSERGGYDRGNHSSRPHSRQVEEARPYAQPDREISGRGRDSRGNDARQSSRYPSRYNTPVAVDRQEFVGRGRVQSKPQIKQNAQRQLAPPDQSRAPRRQKQSAQPQNQRPQPRNTGPQGRGSRANPEDDKANKGRGR
ncbi:MAG: hypothetical protein ACRCXD_06815, partial [Luteolibacter sp.]